MVLLQEVLTLSIATTVVEDDTLSAVNIAGMVICLLGITLHVILKVNQMRRKLCMYMHAVHDAVHTHQCHSQSGAHWVHVPLTS